MIVRPRSKFGNKVRCFADLLATTESQAGWGYSDRETEFFNHWWLNCIAPRIEYDCMLMVAHLKNSVSIKLWSEYGNEVRCFSDLLFPHLHVVFVIVACPQSDVYGYID